MVSESIIDFQRKKLKKASRTDAVEGYTLYCEQDGLHGVGGGGLEQLLMFPPPGDCCSSSSNSTFQVRVLPTTYTLIQLQEGGSRAQKCVQDCLIICVHLCIGGVVEPKYTDPAFSLISIQVQIQIRQAFKKALRHPT